MPSKKKSSIHKKVDRVFKWLLFTVSFAVLPLFMRFLLVLINRDDIANDLWTAFLNHFSPDGEILIVSAVIVGEGITELLGRSSQIQKSTRLILGVMSILFVLVASGLYAAITMPDPMYIGNPEFLKQLSNYSFGLSLILGFLSKTVGSN
ncbi:MAG: hypothetical protein AAGG51_04640 [Cyanobacteria bacterium P01_G01_bin.54]